MTRERTHVARSWHAWGAAFVLVALCADAQTPAPPVSSVEQGRAALDAGRVADALALLAEPARAGDLAAQQLSGVAQFLSGEPVRAIALLEGVLPRLAPDAPARRESVQVLGLAYFLAGRIREAIPLLEQTRAFAGADPKLAYALGMAYVHTQQADKAREAWARAYGFAPDAAAARLLTAQMMMRAGFNDQAEVELKAALAKDPSLPQANLLLGQIALFRGRDEEAVALFETERARNPASAAALDRLGEAYVRLGRWDQALDVLQRSTWINPYSSSPYILLGRAHLKKSDALNAEGMLRKALEYDPNNQAAHYLLAQALQRLGRDDEARREFQIAERLPGPVER